MADATDSKSVIGNNVWVQVPSPVPGCAWRLYSTVFTALLFFCFVLRHCVLGALRVFFALLSLFNIELLPMKHFLSHRCFIYEALRY